MELDAQVSKYLTQEIPECRNNLTNSFVELRNLAEHCHKDLSPLSTPPLQRTMVYAAQSLASVAYQINVLATQMVDLLNLQVKQWGEMEHQISDITQQVNFYQEKHSRHLIGKFTTEKPVHLMRRVNPPSQKEPVTKYERHPINFTMWDHVGHGSPTRDSTPAMDNPAKKNQAASFRASYTSTKPVLTTQSTIDSDIYGTSFDVLRYAKKPVAHSIPVARPVPRSDTSDSGSESPFTNTTEMFVQGHTTASLYDSLVQGGDGSFSVSEKGLLSISVNEPDPEASIFTPSPLLDSAVSPTLPDPPEPLEPLDKTPEPNPDLLDADLYSEEVTTPSGLPSPFPLETPKPPRPINPAPARPPPLAAGLRKRSSQSAPGVPPGAAPPPPTTSFPITAPSSRPPPPPSTGPPARPAPLISGSSIRPTRPAPPPGNAIPKLSSQDTNLPQETFIDNPNVPAPPPDMPKPVQADPRIPKPPPNIPKDGVKKQKADSLSDSPAASPAKKLPPKPEPKGFNPADIFNAQRALKSRKQFKTGATIDVPTEVTSTPKLAPLAATQSVPIPPAPLSPPPVSVPTAATPQPSGTIPDPPPDIPQGWKKIAAVSKSAPISSKPPAPKVQQARAPAFDPSQILLKLRPQGGAPAATPPAPPKDVNPAPPNYIEKVETIYPYKALKDDELNFAKGKMIYVLKKNPDEWYEGLLDGVRGLFPANYVKTIN